MNKSTLGLRLTFIMTTLVLGCFVILLVMNTTALMDIVPSHYIAPNENYDKFCENIKQNDLRKSTTLFLVNIMKNI